MVPQIYIPISLILTSVLVTAVLGIAWYCFGKQRHAATWATAFALATFQWVLVLVGRSIPALTSPMQTIYAFASVGTMALVAIGFRQRAGLPERRGLIFGTSLAVGTVGAVTVLAVSDASFNTAPQMLMAAAFLWLSAVTMIEQGRKASEAERAAIAVLVLFGLFNLICAGIAGWRVISDHPVAIEAHRSAMMLGMPAGFTALGLFSVFLLAADLAATMRKLATVDPLTGILNRRGLEQAAEVAIANARRHGRPLAVIVADLDRFKVINDTFGHAAGDRVLQRFVQHVESATRRGDLVGRLGGEEFALLLVDTHAAGAADVTERIRVSLADLTPDMPGKVPLTCSFGIAMLEDRDEILDQVLIRADRALYRSKLAGRDRVTLDCEAPVTVFG